MPKKLIPTADALADVAEALVDEAGRVTEDQGEDEVLDALSELRLDTVAERFDVAEGLMKESREYYDIADTAVYGGGLYI
jgi:hypothetical protein